jgi:glycosyltransferase involved in cell wall biosynthesis
MSRDVSMDEMADRCERHEVDCTRIDYRNMYRRRTRSLGAVADWAQIRSLTGWMNQEDADVIHLNHQNVEDGLDLAIAGAASQKRCVGTVHVTHSMQSLGAVAGWARDFWSRRCFQRSRLPLIAISAASATDLSQFLGQSKENGVINPNEVFTVPNGVPEPTPADRRELRKQWGMGENEFVLGCIARLEHQKNPLFIVPLMKRLPESVRLVWVGDGRLRAALEQELAKHGLGNRVVLDGWRDDASARLAGFDAFFLPSFYEGLPLALLEAMAMGLPVVASRVDGYADAVEDGNSGLLCDVNDCDSWEKAIRGLVSDRALRVALGNAARQRYLNEFSVRAMAERTLEVYESVLKSKR